MSELILIIIVFAAAIFSSQLFHRFHIPWVVGLMVVGVLLGPNALNVFSPNETIEFLGEVGLIFLMFMVGLEIRFSNMKKVGWDIATVATASGGIPFLIGVLIGLSFGFSLVTSVFLGIVFISSSIAVVVPVLSSHGLLSERVGKIIVGSSVAEDVFSLILLSILLQNINPETMLPLPVFYATAIFLIFSLRFIINKMHGFMFFRTQEGDVIQGNLLAIFIILFGTVILFEFLGLHVIIAAFFAGLIMSESVTGEVIRQKLRTIGYGIFIPVFFILIGTKTDLSVFSEINAAIFLTLAVVVGSIVAKFASGVLGARLIRMDFKDATLLGAAKVPQLTTTLAVAFAGSELGLLPPRIIVALVILSIVTTFIGPFVVAGMRKKEMTQKTLPFSETP